jgi:hypothetical protein
LEPLVQDPGQTPLDPSHTYAPQLASPAMFGEQVPVFPGRLHWSQAPEQALVQQKPSAQAFVRHSWFVAQLEAVALRGTQLDPLQ